MPVNNNVIYTDAVLLICFLIKWWIQESIEIGELNDDMDHASWAVGRWQILVHCELTFGVISEGARVAFSTFFNKKYIKITLINQ